MRVGDRGRVRFVAGYFRGGWDSQAAVDRFDPGRSGEAGVGGLDGGGVVGGDGVGGGESDEFVGWVEGGGGDDVVAGWVASWAWVWSSSIQRLQLGWPHWQWVMVWCEWCMLVGVIVVVWVSTVGVGFWCGESVTAGVGVWGVV